MITGLSKLKINWIKNSSGTELSVAINPPDQFGENPFHLVTFNTATSSGLVSASSVFQQHCTEIGFRGPVENGFTYGKACNASARTPQQTQGDITIGVQGINHESVANINGIFFTQIDDHQVIMHCGTPDQLQFGKFPLVQIRIGPLLDIRQLEDFIDRRVPAIGHQVVQKGFMENNKPFKIFHMRPGVNKKIQQRPLFRRQDILYCILSGISLIYGVEQFLGNIRKRNPSLPPK